MRSICPNKNSLIQEYLIPILCVLISDTHIQSSSHIAPTLYSTDPILCSSQSMLNQIQGNINSCLSRLITRASKKKFKIKI